MTTFDVEAYEAWLLAEGYRPATVRVGVTAAKRIVGQVARGEELAANASTITEIRRIQLYLGQDTPARMRKAFADARARFQRARATPLQKRRDQQERAQRKSVSYSDEDWRKLTRRLRRDATRGDATAATLLVLTETGCRIGDVLPVTRQRLLGGVRAGQIRLVQKGGTERVLPVPESSAWQLLHETWTGRGGATVAHLLAPGGEGDTLAGRGAYQAARRALTRTHEELGLQGRPHLHRLRRTVGVQSIRETGDIELTRQLLGQASLSSTQTYVDEARTDDLEELQGRIRKRFTEDTDAG